VILAPPALPAPGAVRIRIALTGVRAAPTCLPMEFGRRRIHELAQLRRSRDPHDVRERLLRPLPVGQRPLELCAAFGGDAEHPAPAVGTGLPGDPALP
jgi:hypothetical protein